MPSLIQNDDEAREVAQALSDGTLSGEPAQRAAADLELYANESDSRDLFRTTKLQATPHQPSIDVAAQRFASLRPQAFASEKARQNFEEQNPELRASRAAELGVDTVSGIDPELRAKAALLNFNPEIQAMALEELVRQQIDPEEVPYGIPLMQNIEGVPSVLTRQDDGSYRYHAVDPSGLDTGDFAEVAAELPSVVLESGGAILGALGVGGLAGAATAGAGAAPGAVVGSALGSGIAGYFSLDARAELARLAGVPDEIIDEAVTDADRWYNSLLAAGGDLFVAGALGSARSIINKKGGRLLEPEDVARVYDDVADALKQTADFKAKTGREMPLTLGSLTGDTSIIQAEKVAAGRARGKIARELAEEATHRDRAVQESLRDMTQDRVRTPSDNVRGIEEVTADVQAGVRGQTADVNRLADEAVEELDEFGRVVDDLRSPDTYVKVRESVYDAAEDARINERKAWQQYRKEVAWKQGEGSNVQIHSPANSPIKRVLLEMDDDAGRALLNSTRRSQEAFVADAGLPQPGEGATSGLAGEFLDPRELHFTLSDLKRRVRQAERGVDPDGFRVTDMRNMINAIEETIETQPMRYMRAGRAVTEEKAARVRDAWRLANDTTVARHTLYDNANMRTLLEVNPRTKEMAMPQGMIYNNLFRPNDPRFLDDAMEAVGHDPLLKARLADELVKKHRNATRTDFGGDAHRRFIEEHSDHLRTLGIDPGTLRGAHGLSMAARAAKDRATRVGRRVAQTFGKRLADDTTDAVNIHDELMQVSPQKARNLMRYLDDADPALATEVRDHSLVQVRRMLASKGDTEVNYGALWKLVDEKSDTLRQLHGAEYVKNLQLFKRTQQLAERTGLGRRAIGQDQQPWYIDLTRSVMGPLDKKQRFISAVQRSNKRLMARGARAVISKPDDLNKLVRLRNRTIGDVIRDQTAVDLLRSLGYDPATQNEEAALAAASSEPLQTTAPAGNSIVPGRESPAEAVGGQRPQGGARGASLEAPRIELLKDHEGFSGTTYTDSTGHKTVGFGRNLDANPVTDAELKELGMTKAQFDAIVKPGSEGLSKEEANVLFARDYARAVRDAAKLPGFSAMNGPRRDALISMVVNLGGSEVRSNWPNFLKAIAKGDYDEAANEMLRGKEAGTTSKWLEQTQRRAAELAEMMRTGVRLDVEGFRERTRNADRQVGESLGRLF
jgi:lysozyme